MTEHKSIAAALATAQTEMSKALKQATNPHFRKQYADLGNVMDACMPALNKHGICVVQPIEENEHGRCVKTILIHSSGEKLECSVPLIVQKNDMQGLGSAITYARRYGLMSMAGIAPEDDDGNAAAKAPPKQKPQTVSPEQYVNLRDKAEAAGVDEERVCKQYDAPSFEMFPAASYESAMKKLQMTIDAKQPRASDSIEEDQIPY